MSLPSGVFIHRRRVSWGETDVAGAVDLSTVTRYTMEALESWFISRVGSDWHDLTVNRRISTPFVRADFAFHNRVPASEHLAVHVRIARVGRSSATFEVQGCTEAANLVCWSAQMVCVFANADSMQSIAIPPEYRLAFEQDALLSADR